MAQQLFDWLLQVPKVIGDFGNWLINPLYEPYIRLSPLQLLGVAGVGVIIAIIGVHIVRLFVG